MSTSAFEDHCWKDLIPNEILNIYKAYHRETYVGKNPALLVIDLYNLAYEGGAYPVHELVEDYPSSCGIHAWNALKPTQELIQEVREQGIAVIYSTRTQVKVNSTFRKMRNVKEDSFEIKEEVKPKEDDVIIFKERASCFFGTPLVSRLRKMGVDSLIVVGESTSGCVRASVVDAYSYGFHTVVVEECCFDRSELSHKINLFDLHHKYADVMNVNEVIKGLKEIKLKQ
ncbi:isochorismatase family protein [Halalkalibacter okhensis]|uniref:isochorismatase family protein n=1 Tax=Halalkalibacter okhensis TaxID=333138 RepID=UPI0008A882CE|nr:isochorismatase family protein [Halalkalibacter okhensis]